MLCYHTLGDVTRDLDDVDTKGILYKLVIFILTESDLLIHHV